MTKDVSDAVKKLTKAFYQIPIGCVVLDGRMVNPRGLVSKAIRHIATPDRDIYPKLRRKRKTGRRLTR